METFEVNAESRENMGKGASRRLRREGKIPGVVYGANTDVTPITVNHNEISRHLEKEAFYSHILTLRLGKVTEQVVLKDLQRHPYKQEVLHLDLLRIAENEKLTMRIPLHFLNSTTCIGVKQNGGVINHVMNDIEVSCLPRDLPEYIEVDLAEVNIGERVHLADLKLPKGVDIISVLHGGDVSQTVATVHLPKVVQEETKDEGEPETSDEEDAE